MSLFRSKGGRTRRLVAFLRRRAKTERSRRLALDETSFPRLVRKRAVVFTDTADFTVRTARDGILHFLMVFDGVAREAARVIRKTGGELVKVEADSFLIRYDDVAAACKGVTELDATLVRLNEGRADDERVHFSYGIGYGDVLDLDDDMFGLEVNLASKLGEDLAEHGEALLTPAAAAALSPALLARVVPYRVITFGKQAIPVSRLKLRGSRRRTGVRRAP